MTETPPERKRWRWLKREAIDLGDVVVQIVAVVIGILLALFINNWVTQRQQQQSAAEAMRAIRAELMANRTALHQSAAHLIHMADAMQSSPRNQGQPARWCFQWDEWDGFDTPNLVESAYQTALTTQALSYLPFKQAQQVAQVYGHQRTKQKSFDLVDDNILVAGPQTLDVCLTGIVGIVQDEQVLDAQYDPLIGPDKYQWPAQPRNPLPQSGSSK